MTVMDKRKMLDDFCDWHGACQGCPLKSPVCRCGCGTHFLSEGPERMTDEEIEMAWGVVFAHRQPVSAVGAETPEFRRPTEPPAPEHQRHFSTGAVRDDATGKGRFDLLPWGAIHALAKHCERGALHYGERNVDKGIPQHSLIDSGLRHLGQYIQGDIEPHHLVAALWNIAWAVEQEIKRPELVDLPERTEKSGSAI